MKRHFSPSAGAIAVAVVLLFTTTSAKAGENPWIEVRSPHFSVITDGGESRGREAALRFEQMRAVFGNLLNREKMVSVPVPLQIIAFRNGKGLKQVVPIWKGKPISLSGLYQAGEDRNFIALDLSAEHAWETVFHEYAHMLLNANVEATAVWFDEGFAEYYSTIRVSDKQVVLGGAPSDAGYTLRNNSWIPADTLFSVQHNSKIYNESGSERGMFYTQSWAVVHYLFDLRQLDALQTYFNLTNKQHVAVPEAIQRAFGMSPKEFDKAVQKRIFGAGITEWTLDAPIKLNSKEYTVVPLDPLDQKAIIADMHVHSPEYGDKAITEFQEVLAANPKHPAALRGLGYAYLRKGDFGPAAPYFQQAAELDSKDPRVHYYYALMLQHGGGAVPPTALDTMIRELNTAIQLDPALADAYYLLGFAQMNSGDPKAALASMQTARRLNAREERYALGVAEAYMAAREFDKADELLKVVLTSNNAQLAARARQDSDVVARMRDFERQRKERERSGLANTVIPASDERPLEATDDDDDSNEPPKIIVDQRPVKFTYAALDTVDCSQAPAAVLNLTIKGKPVKMFIRDRAHVLLLGADEFSCDWRNRKVLVNYRPGGEHENDLVSLELQ